MKPNIYYVLRNISFLKIQTTFLFWLLIFFLGINYVQSQVDTGGNATTGNHSKQVIGYITNWDAWKTTSAGVPGQGALTHLNIDYSKYTILNYSFFGVAVDGSLHSGDHRNKQIYQDGVVQQPADILFTDIYSSWDMHILFGEIDPIQHINEEAKQRAEAQGFVVELGGSSWTHPTWGLSGPLPVPLHKESGAPGLIELAHAKGVKLMASIGGWSMCKHFPEMAADPVKRARFIEDCKKLINMGFDGIDLDWEYPGPYSGMNFTGTEADFGNFQTLVQEIRNAIGPDKLITAAMSADPRKLDGFNWTQLSGTMDYFNMMTYDFNGGWSNIAGHNAPVYPYDGAEVPFFNWQSTLDKLVSLGVPTNKINMGVPFYGRGVITEGNAALNAPTVKRNVTVQPDGPISTSADYTNWPQEVYDGTPNYFFIKQKTGTGSGWTRHWDDQAKVPYMTNGKFFLSYDDEESIGIKAQYINDNNLAGTIVWTVYGDLEISGSAQSFGPKLKRWSTVKSPLINKLNEVFSGTGNPAPSITITSPAQGAIFNVGDNVTINATASDSNGTVAKVEFYNGSLLLGEDTSSPYTFTWNNVPQGSQSIIAKAYDNEGASATASITITVNGTGNELPTVALISPQDGDSFEEGANINIAATASDSDGTIDRVAFYNGDTLLNEDTIAPYEFSWNNVAAGSYTITAKAIDNNSGEATSSVSITVTAVGNCTAPAYVHGQIYTQGDRVSYQGNEYEAKWWTQNNDPVTNNENVWILIGPCGGGNNAPEISLTSPNNGDTFIVGNTVSISATASDSDGTITKVEFFVGNTLVSEDTTAPYSASWTATIGNHNITAKATDNEGGTTTSSVISITVNNDGGNTSPTINLTSPSNNATYTVGDSVTIAANANDTDGTISKVVFYVDNNVVNEDTTAPFSTNWTATQGSHIIFAKAVDNEGGETNSSSVSITVETSGGGGCTEPQYVENGGYVAGSLVQNDGNLYECKPHPFSGWCNGAAWAYEPGVGAYWGDAWILVRDCGDNPPPGDAPTVSITQPTSGQSFNSGSTITINASATDTDGTVTKVEFFSNGTLIGEDQSSPFSFSWSNVPDGSYSITARATDNDNLTGDATAVNISVGSTPPPPGGELPKRVLVGYWHNFSNGSSTPKLREVSTKWDVICVAFAEPKPGSNSDMVFNPYNIYSGVQEFKDDVAAVRARGQKVLISIGGANAVVELHNQTEKNEFVTSMTSIINTYGFDGLDIDLEGSSLSLAAGDTDFRNPTTPKIVNLIDATKIIRSNVGAGGFILSMAPETLYVQGGFSNYGGASGAYLPVIYGLRSEMNYIHVQHYNTGCMLGLDGVCYSSANADFHVAMADMLLQGFPAGGNQFPALRQDQVAIGLPANSSAAGSGYTTPAEVHKALDYIIKGQSFGGRYTLRNPSGYPNFRGLMTWSINWDIASGFGFSDPHRTYLDALDARANSIPEDTKNLKLHPNPFKQNVHLTVELKNDKFVTAEVYNQIGQKVISLMDKRMEAGSHRIDWDSNEVPPGLYFLKVNIGKETKTYKLIKE